VGQPAGEIFRLVHRESGQTGESPIAKALVSGEPTPLNSEFSLDRGSGTPQPVVYSTRPVKGPASQSVGAVVVFRNPDEMSLSPNELIRSNRFETLGQLAGGIAHDFNNLLTTILGGVSLAKENRDLQGLENSERACLAAKGLAKQLLTFAKGGNAVRQVVKPGDLLSESLRIASAGSTVKVELTVAPDTATVCVDRAQMLQVFQNLIINAIQAMTTGQGQLWIRAGNVTLAEGAITSLPAGAYVALEVRDNGAGIRPEHVEKIFAPFFTTKKTGTGLGLATVLSIVKRHGGQMGLETELGVGTAFTVYLPHAERPAEIEARKAPTLRFAARTGRILFMDDDEEICTLTGIMLESLGYKFDLARHGEEAIQLYKRYLNIGRRYDAVIMDLTIIGGMGGEQTFRELRALDPEVCAIMTSGYDNDEMARQYLDMGFCDYLTKPYRVGELGKSLRSVLDS
jgi:two-component system, cell cycle sensor histidine kinase and response regulator CckA